jgi:4-alpha-glucanotransferase
MSKRENESVDYYLFLQYILDKQWKELKEYANLKNVKIIGDLPIYPDYNSCELEYYSKYYDLEDGKMKYVSGASPDYFNSEGQKWGHPLYNFNEMKKDNYKYLIDRYMEFLKRYDIVRIDHFRAFDTYYKIPIELSAKYGFYVEGPRESFFDELFKYTTSDRFIVEDLGDITKETEALRDKYHFTKMKILQYTLNLKNIKDEYDDSENMVVYTGNHDNNTIIGWYNNLSDSEKENLKTFLKNNNCYDEKINVALIKYCLKSSGKIVIIPVQDILGLDENSRINLPGHEFDDNWSWKLLNFEELKNSINVFR